MNLPNRLTLLRIFMIPFFIVLMEVNFHLGGFQLGGQEMSIQCVLAAVIFAVASATDWLDGHLARKNHLITNFGKFADPLADKMLVIAALIELILLDQAPAWVVTLIVMRELAVTGLRLLIVEGDGTVLAAAWPGKVKTTSQMLAILFLLLNDFPFQFLPFSVGKVLLYFALAATLYSGYDYFRQNKDVFSDGM
ncbi:CDP-diacylglycerol--glycerol-3-phosphate 3-phosphatidyltransferase [Aerococcus christensenii]|uniref:CDP-diacylglycerol--glycerol-3-phosphate 3-phosphatidyltransferase n=2 Tax=Aerococcus christensenii TaxID=87541 RepID=A0A2I1K7V6_9LACT|nr:CDP-diacylglycerol--glycerol-3-phosphate 3-phosphatidyltransferase [Aerococcus christensenii]MDK8233997.1 CDP-diacylglycerol--glycerol-3-phosphate 3-phosphatidyltransferase [Aerococcus christensenii]PKY91723.1 CDP-diacylglycerol--glycerol-3-phosphate 3-phosphatidyltransferase [Aerococcus christensenii]